MKKRRRKKLVHEGQYVAEVDVELIDMNQGWSPYLSLDDAYKLDDIRSGATCSHFYSHPYRSIVTCRRTAYSAQIGHQFRSIPATFSRVNRPPDRSEATLVFLLLFRFVFLSQGRSYFPHGFPF